MKDLLVVLDSNSRDEFLSYAVSVGRLFDAHLTATGIALDFVPPPSFVGEYPYQYVSAAMDENQKAVQAIYDKLRGAAELSGLMTELNLIEGLPGRARQDFSRMTRTFDMIIIEQPSRDGESGDELLVEAALFGSARPVLIAPYIQTAPIKLDHVLVGWDGGLAAARAVGDAMPILKKAGKVDVVTITSKRVDEKEMPGFDIARHLARHGVDAQVKRLPATDEAAATLLSYAADSDSDLMVMGGYGHSRLREFVLGGTTRNILSSMTVPVLMSH